MKNWLKILLGLAVSAIALYFFAKDLSVAEVKASISQINLAYICAAAILVMLTFVPRGIRLQYVLAPCKLVSPIRLGKISCIGFAANNLLPARLGEVVRVVYLSKKEKFPVSTSVGSLIVERFSDIMAFLVFGILPLFFLSGDVLDQKIIENARIGGNISLRGIAYFCSAIFLLCSFLTALLIVVPERIKGIFKKIASALPNRWHTRLEETIENFFSVIGFLKSVTSFAIVGICTLLIPFFYALAVWFLCRAFNSGFSVVMGGVVIIVTAFAVALPSAPGFIGTLHFAIMKSLALFGMSGEMAGAVALIYHLCNYVPVTLFGIVFYLTDQVSLKGIKMPESDGKE